MTSDMSVVLVHGAWADGSSWSKVISGLWSKNITVISAPLPLSSLQDDIDALDHALDRIEGPVVLAGHAYSGGVVGSTRSEKVKALVYVTALAPDEGETVADVFYRATPHPSSPKLEPDAHGLIWLPDEAFSEAFAQNASAEE
jgi:pimeloyl-ACP methyl ester carboxylesterase